MCSGSCALSHTASAGEPERGDCWATRAPVTPRPCSLARSLSRSPSSLLRPCLYLAQLRIYHIIYTSTPSPLPILSFLFSTLPFLPMSYSLDPPSFLLYSFYPLNLVRSTHLALHPSSFSCPILRSFHSLYPLLHNRPDERQVTLLLCSLIPVTCRQHITLRFAFEQNPYQLFALSCLLYICISHSFVTGFLPSSCHSL